MVCNKLVTKIYLYHNVKLIQKIIFKKFVEPIGFSQISYEACKEYTLNAN